MMSKPLYTWQPPNAVMASLPLAFFSSISGRFSMSSATRKCPVAHAAYAWEGGGVDREIGRLGGM